MINQKKLHIVCDKSKKNKISKYLYDDFDFYMWPYEEQTQIKHRVLKEYLKVWAIKLGSVNNINYYDGFSGCGAYYDAENKQLGFGSPIIAKTCFYEANRNNKSCFYINDKSQENIENLKKVFNYRNISISNVCFTLGEFEDNIKIFLDDLEKNPIPTFFMIDPFGINASFETIERIMHIPKTEVLFNFMYNFTRRFTGYKNSEHIITNLFGTENWKQYKNYLGDNKEIALKDLYREQLKKCAKYVYQYRMSFPHDKRTYYYLFHASNNRDGCSIMKDSFAKINMGNVEFLGPNQPNPDQIALWDQTDEKIDKLKSIIWNKYKGISTLYSNIVDDYLDSTVYLERHIKQAILSMKDEYVSFTHKNPNTRTIDYPDIVNFYKEPVFKPIQKTFF